MQTPRCGRRSRCLPMCSLLSCRMYIRATCRSALLSSPRQTGLDHVKLASSLFGELCPEPHDVPLLRGSLSGLLQDDDGGSSSSGEDIAVAPRGTYRFGSWTASLSCNSAYRTPAV